MRYFIILAFNGTNYHGWQYQPNAKSIQEILTKALNVVLHSKIEIMGAGRTDTGVHAKKMVAHFDCDVIIDIPKTIHKLNSFLPQDVVVYNITPVQATAHARFDAKKRTYQYHIHLFKDAFLENKSWYFNKKLRVDLMNQACDILKSHHNFQAFSKVNTDVNSFECCIFEAFWEEKNNQYIFTISANRFLRNMVRAIVGTLVNVGLEKISLADFNTIIESKNRGAAGFSVPAHGLYLTEIQYDYKI